MKHYRISLAIAALVFASLACQAVMGGGSSEADSTPASSDSAAEPDVQQLENVQDAAEAPTVESAGSKPSISTEFPMTEDAFNVVEAGGSLIYYTKLSANDALQFYRDEYTSQGYTERELLTLVQDGMFSVVFDGDPSGKAVVIQSVDLGDGSRTIAIRLEDV